MSRKDLTVVLALGGNALIPDPLHQSVDDQYEACVAACAHIAKLHQNGARLVITHGNGPQVGFISRRSELSRNELHPVPLNLCVADTQGSIGVMLQRALHNHTQSWDSPLRIVTLVTQVLVDAEDPDFKSPSKPIGAFLDEATARQREAEEGWFVREDAGRGFRRVVPSPKPVKIIEKDAVLALSDTGYVVVAAGGGGIPVIAREDGTIGAVEAVVDKDHTSSLLARELGVDILMIATNVEQVSIHFGTPQQEALGTLNAAQARAYIEAGHFGKGSMLPKVQAAVDFAEATGKDAVITSIHTITEAFHGHTGTRITP